MEVNHSNRYAAGRSFRFQNLPREANHHYRLYERSLTQIQKLKQRKIFLRQCMVEHVLPPSLKVSLKCDTTPFHPIKRTILDDRIKSIKFEIEDKFLKARRHHSYLKFFVTSGVVKNLEENAHQYSRWQGELTKGHLIRKLNKLKVLTVWYDFTMPENVVNLSTRQLNFFERSVLGLGLGFNLSPSKDNIIPTAASFDKFLFHHRDKIPSPDVLRGAISPLLLSIQRETPSLPKSLQQALTGLQKERGIKVMSADKGKKVVIMDHAEYISKMENILADSDTYETLRENPIEDFNKLVRNVIDATAKKCPDKDLITQFKRVNCSLAYMYGVPKLHKENCPLRPVISSIGTATRPLSGWLASLLSPYLGKISLAHLKNSVELKTKLMRFAAAHSTNNIRLGSLDVVSLFTRVPTDHVLDFVSRKIDEKIINVPIPKDCFLELLRLCVNHNYFQFEDKFYRQKFGIAMGSPLSPVLANLFMEYIESELLPNISDKPVLWLRYVDDILFAWPDNLDFSQFFNQVNSLVPSIKFTCEWEQDDSIPFLDTTIHRLTSGFSFAIYRKPTHSNQFIHFFSWHPDHVKKGALHTLLLRAYRICDGVYLNREINFLYNAFMRVGFPERYIDSVHSRVKRNFFQTQDLSTPEPPPPTISLPYNEYVQKSVVPIFKAHGCRVVNYASNAIKRNLVKNRPPYMGDKNDLPCVYKIPCKTCPRSYYGESGRGLSTRVSEHERYVRREYKSKAVYKHKTHATPNHEIDFEGAQALYHSDNWYNRLVVESTLILTKNNFNNGQSTLAIDNLASQIITKTHPYAFNPP